MNDVIFYALTSLVFPLAKPFYHISVKRSMEDGLPPAKPHSQTAYGASIKSMWILWLYQAGLIITLLSLRREAVSILLCGKMYTWGACVRGKHSFSLVLEKKSGYKIIMQVRPKQG